MILITGGTRGIGRALASAAAAEGYDLALNYRTGREEVEALAADLGRHGVRVIAVAADVSASADATSLVDAVFDRFGRLDCVVNNARVGKPVGIGDLDEAEFERTLRVNLTGAFLVSQAAWPRMTERGVDSSSCRRARHARAERSPPPTPPPRAGSRASCITTRRTSAPTHRRQRHSALAHRERHEARHGRPAAGSTAHGPSRPCRRAVARAPVMLETKYLTG